MKPTLQIGLKHTLTFTVPQSKTVPALYPERAAFLAMPAGLQVTATVELIEIEGRKLTFLVKAHDGVDLISTG